MNTPKISIIVPVYKVEKYLRRCLDSIVAQTFTDWECILIDDGSPDNSGKICDEYAEKDNRFKVFHQENAGVSAARNKGLDEAKGEWIGFVDSDDWIENDYLAAFNPDELEGGSLYVHSNYYHEYGEKIEIFGVTDNALLRCSDMVTSFMELEKARCGMLNSPCLKLFQFSVIRNNSLKFDKNISLGEDNLFVLSYLFSHEIVNVAIKKYCGYHYIDNPNSLVHRIIPSKDYIYFSEHLYVIQCKLLNKLRIGEKDFVNFTLSQSQKRLYYAIQSYYYENHTYNERKRFVLNVKDYLKKYENKILSKCGKKVFMYSFACKYFPQFLLDVLFKIANSH